MYRCMYTSLRRFLQIEAISRQKEARSRDYALLLFQMTSRVLYSAQYHRQNSVHSMLLNSLEHCICTTTMTNILPDRDSSLRPPGYEPQPIRMSHRGRSYNLLVLCMMCMCVLQTPDTMVLQFCGVLMDWIVMYGNTPYSHYACRHMHL